MVKAMGYTVVTYRFDNGTELLNNYTIDFLRSEGSSIEPSTAHTAYQNGVAERGNGITE